MENQFSAHLFHLEERFKGPHENKLRDTRVLRRISQMALMLSTGINATKISWIERGYIKPKREEVIKLSKALGVQPRDIFPESKGSEK